MTERLPRKLAAIVYADVADYSRLTGEDEDGTHRTLSDYLDLISTTIESHHGQVKHYAGDAVLAKFDAVVDAMSAAVAIQGELKTRNLNVPDRRKVQFRIGVNLGDVIEDRGDIYGDGVNVAARLESLADPGGICISDAVRSALGNKLDLHYDDLGEQEVKNIAAPVRTYKIATAKEASPAVKAAQRPLELSSKPSIAVLPFDNMSADPEQEYFSDGVTEDIITALSRFQSFLVIARNSSFYYKGRSIRVKEVAKDLGVQYVVEGSVRKAGNRVRITAQLIDARPGTHLWAERYERELEDIFEVQDEIAQTISAAITPELSQAEQHRAHRKPPQNLSAWEWYHRGLWHLYRFTLEDMLEAQRLFQRAIEYDSEFGAAHSGFAYALLQEIWYSDPDDPDSILARALALARKGCALDDHDAMGHFILGRILVRRDELTIARAELEKAIELNPALASSYFGLGDALLHLLKFEEALAAFQTAARLSPRDPHAWTFTHFQAWPLLGLKRYEEAVDAERSALRNPNAGFHAYIPLISALGHLGRKEEAEVEIRAFRERQPDFGCARARRLMDVREWFREEIIDGLRKAGLPD